MTKWKDTTLDEEASELALSASKKKYPPAKSDEAIAYYNSYMPPYEIHLFDGSIVVVPYSELDERLAELKQTYKERRKRGVH